MRRAPLPPIGSLVTWTMTAWPALRSCSIRGAGPVDVLGAVVHLAGVEHAVAAAADVDERGLHAREHVLHPPEVDVADHRGRAGAGHVVLDEDVFFEDRDLVALAVLGDHHELVGDPRRRRRLLAAAAAVATGAGPGGADATGGTARGDLLFDRLGLLGLRRVLGGGLVGPLAAPAAARLRRAARRRRCRASRRRAGSSTVSPARPSAVAVVGLLTAPATATPAPALLRTGRLRPRRPPPDEVASASPDGSGFGWRGRCCWRGSALGSAGASVPVAVRVVIGRGAGSAGSAPAAATAASAASSAPASTGAGRRPGSVGARSLTVRRAAHRSARRRRLASCVVLPGLTGLALRLGALRRLGHGPARRLGRRGTRRLGRSARLGSSARAPSASARRRASPRPRWASPAPCPNRSCGGAVVVRARRRCAWARPTVPRPWPRGWFPDPWSGSLLSRRARGVCRIGNVRLSAPPVERDRLAGAACGPALRENPRAGQRAYRTGTFLVPAFAIHEAPGWLPSEIARRLDVRSLHRTNGRAVPAVTSAASIPATPPGPGRHSRWPWKVAALAHVGYPAHPRVPHPNPTTAG